MSVAAGLFAMVNSNFCGFIIKPQDYPTFWIFLYWLSPLHYGFEGVVVTQFHKDHSIVEVFPGQPTSTAEQVIKSYYSEWSYEHRGYDVLALLIMIAVLR
jgi:hypothetical protein